MIRRLVLIFGVALAVVSVGCGPEKAILETPSPCQAEDLRVSVSSGTMEVSWRNNCDQLIAGYNIYIAQTPVVRKYPDATLPKSIVPFNKEPFAGDTNPDDGVEHFIADGLENHRKYFVSIRIVNPDRTVSKPSNEVVAVCGPSGEIELSVRYRSEQDGFAFERNEYVRADALDNDVYFFSSEEGDFFNSPVKLDGFLRKSLMAKLPVKGGFDEVRKRIGEISPNPGEQRVAVKKGDWIHLVTPEGGNALIEVIDIFGAGPNRKIRLFFAFNRLPGELIF